MAPQTTGTNRALAVQPEEKPKNKLMSLMEAIKPQIAAVLPKHLTPERMVQIVAVEGSRNPRLYDCTPQSICASVMLASELGLEPSGPLGHAYLIPRNEKVKDASGRDTGRWEMRCTLLVGYKGLAQLARNSGQIARINAQVVYRHEVEARMFAATIEPPTITHNVDMLAEWDRKPGDVVAAYAVIEMKDGSLAQAILPRREIEDRRARSQAKGFSPWQTDYAAMCRKTALRALLTSGMVPMSSEMAKAVHEDDADRPEIETTATERPALPTSGNALSNALGLGPAQPTPAPASSPALDEARRLVAAYLDNSKGVCPPWLPEDELLAAYSDNQLSGLIDRLNSELEQPANGTLAL